MISNGIKDYRYLFRSVPSVIQKLSRLDGAKQLVFYNTKLLGDVHRFAVLKTLGSGISEKA